jgi:hypothetical protein
MFCPNCGAQTLEGAKYCRACGTDVSQVPLALTGELTLPVPAPPIKDSSQLYKAIANTASGVGFLIVALCVLRFAPAGRLWWFWMLIPAIRLLGRALGEFTSYLNAAKVDQRSTHTLQARQILEPPQLSEARGLDSLPPVSVTESTTRILERPSAGPK